MLCHGIVVGVAVAVCAVGVFDGVSVGSGVIVGMTSTGDELRTF
jgi:hypothetical protein